MVSKILCVAEKPAIAKSVANHLGHGQVRTHSIQGNQYVKNYEFSFDFHGPWGECNVVMTSVIGHLGGSDFDERYKNWNSCNPDELFDANIKEEVAKDKQSIADNITRQARYCRALFIWTDCDREGEHIGGEVRAAALKGKANLQVKRARFSNTEQDHVVNAARHAIDLDERQVNAVAARIELDLRLGASFTRFQTLSLRGVDTKFENKVVSYGSCQFPTLGFVVERYFRVRNFVPEPFWTITVTHTRDDLTVTFLWDRHRLFDRAVVTILFERCLFAQTASITDVKTKPASKWRPLPLTTVELQKQGSRFLHMDSQRVMKVAEDLYTKGWISYPRTETDQFDRAINLQPLVQNQTQSNAWGAYAQRLLSGEFRTPRSGPYNDHAHPPIHPVTFVAPNVLFSDDERKVYEFVARRFLACCSDDARGARTTLSLAWGPSETFHASGLRVIERNYLEVYPYERWNSSAPLPEFQIGETFKPDKAMIEDGKTSPPGYLTEPELIGLMDANGIGTDATMAEHITKIREREYVIAQPCGNRAAINTNAATRGGGSRGRGSRERGRGGYNNQGNHENSGGGGSGHVLQFIPTTLGCALIQSYESLGLETSLSRPVLRREMEAKMKAICEGRAARAEVVHEVLEEYRAVYRRVNRQVGMLKATVRRFVVEGNMEVAPG